MQLLLFDRDGVLNKLIYRDYKMRAPIKLDEIQLENYVTEEIDSLREDFEFAIVTNQPDFEKMALPRNLGIEINHQIAEQVGIKSSYICFHSEGKCKCRKPETGLLELAMWAQGFERKNTIMVGDRWTDILAARQAGIRSILISSNIPQSYLPSSNGETPPSSLKPNFTVNDFRGLTQLIKKLKIES